MADLWKNQGLFFKRKASPFSSKAFRKEFPDDFQGKFSSLSNKKARRSLQ
jgi:hypothetical protein